MEGYINLQCLNVVYNSISLIKYMYIQTLKTCLAITLCPIYKNTRFCLKQGYKQSSCNKRSSSSKKQDEGCKQTVKRALLHISSKAYDTMMSDQQRKKYNFVAFQNSVILLMRYCKLIINTCLVKNTIKIQMSIILIMHECINQRRKVKLEYE